MLASWLFIAKDTDFLGLTHFPVFELIIFQMFSAKAATAAALTSCLYSGRVILKKQWTIVMAAVRWERHVCAHAASDTITVMAAASHQIKVYIADCCNR